MKTLYNWIQLETPGTRLTSKTRSRKWNRFESNSKKKSMASCQLHSMMRWKNWLLSRPRVERTMASNRNSHSNNQSWRGRNFTWVNFMTMTIIWRWIWKRVAQVKFVYWRQICYWWMSASTERESAEPSLCATHVTTLLVTRKQLQNADTRTGHITQEACAKTAIIARITTRNLTWERGITNASMRSVTTKRVTDYKLE